MLVDTLRMHPEIVGFGEIFNVENVPERIGFNVEGYDNYSREMLDQRSRDPIRFLEDTIFKERSSDLKSVGFKLFPEQLENNRFARVWDWLLRRDDIRIIYLRRENLLHSLVSLKVAKSTGVWNTKKGLSCRGISVELSRQECEDYFLTRLEYDRKIPALLEGKDSLRLTYETMNRDFKGSMEQVHNFLGVRPRTDIEPRLKKLNNRKMSEIIENYQDLKSFLHSRWGHFFED